MNGDLYAPGNPFLASPFSYGPEALPEPSLSPRISVVSTVTPKIQKEIEEYAKAFGKEARDYVLQKVQDLKLWELLYNDKITMRDWESGNWTGKAYYEDTLGPIKLAIAKATEDEESGSRSDYVHPCAYLVDAYADRVYPLIFGGPDWLQVLPDPNDKVPDIQQLALEERLKLLLIDRLAQGQIYSRMYDALQAAPKYGSVYGHLIYYRSSYKVTIKEELLDISNTREETRVTGEYPVLELIPLDKLLPDSKARHNDIQRWRGIGFRTDKTYDEILAGFDSNDPEERPLYNLNKAEFKKRFAKSKPSTFQDTDELDKDPDQENLEDADSYLTIWTLYIRVPTSEGFRECVVRICTEQSVDDPATGVMIGLLPHPLLMESGLRPLVGAHFIHRQGVLGKGQIEKNRQVLFQLSQFIGQLEDNIRHTCIPTGTYDEDSPVAAFLKDHKYTIPPGTWFPHRAGDPEPLKGVPMPTFNAAVLGDMIKMLLDFLEQGGDLSSLLRGIVQGGDRTAHEVSQLQENAQAPAQTRVELFGRDFVGPLGNIALEMIREFSQGDQTVQVPRGNGQYETVNISADELKNTGRHRVVATITRRDQSSVMKAGTIERVLQSLPVVLQTIAQQGGDIRSIDVQELVRIWLDCLNLEGSERVVQKGLSSTGPPLPGGMAEAPSGPNAGVVPPEVAPGGNGGPLGDNPTDLNANLLALQMQSAGTAGM